MESLICSVSLRDAAWMERVNQHSLWPVRHCVIIHLKEQMYCRLSGLLSVEYTHAAVAYNRATSQQECVNDDDDVRESNQNKSLMFITHSCILYE